MALTSSLVPQMLELGERLPCDSCPLVVRSGFEQLHRPHKCLYRLTAAADVQQGYTDPEPSLGLACPGGPPTVLS